MVLKKWWHWLCSVVVHLVFFLFILDLGNYSAHPPVGALEPAVQVNVFAVTSSSLQKTLPSASERYELALERKINAEEQEREALSKLIALYESAQVVHNEEKTESPFIKVDDVKGAQSAFTTSYEGVPIPSSTGGDGAQHDNKRNSESDLVVSVDPLIVYRYRLIQHITSALPGQNLKGVCLVNLSLSPDGDVLFVSYQEHPRESCLPVRKVFNQRAQLPKAEDPSIYPYLTGLLVKIGGA